MHKLLKDQQMYFGFIA